ncbi:MAG: hypothetical protein Q7V63_09300 [Gammaproteobacteria bacterium]|nr:hypothetical protein [Gammaproteobacteria bacterium]
MQGSLVGVFASSTGVAFGKECDRFDTMFRKYIDILSVDKECSLSETGLSNLVGFSSADFCMYDILDLGTRAINYAIQKDVDFSDFDVLYRKIVSSIKKIVIAESVASASLRDNRIRDFYNKLLFNAISSNAPGCAYYLLFLGCPTGVADSVEIGVVEAFKKGLQAASIIGLLKPDFVRRFHDRIDTGLSLPELTEADIISYSGVKSLLEEYISLPSADPIIGHEGASEDPAP